MDRVDLRDIHQGCGKCEDSVGGVQLVDGCEGEKKSWTRVGCVVDEIRVRIWITRHLQIVETAWSAVSAMVECLIALLWRS